VREDSETADVGRGAGLKTRPYNVVEVARRGGSLDPPARHELEVVLHGPTCTSILGTVYVPAAVNRVVMPGATWHHGFAKKSSRSILSREDREADFDELRRSRKVRDSRISELKP
jgi:hypothetical protein